MVLTICSWCARSRDTTFRTWRSVRTGQQLVGNVCPHCWGGGTDDSCRTCQYRRTHVAFDPPGDGGIRPIQAADIVRLVEMQHERRSRKHQP